jgi:general secretion pathway protein H
VAGFTLIEVMIVVVIVAIMAGAVVMSIPRDFNDQFKEQADRFRVLLRLAQDEAILQSREFSLGFTESGYAFFQLDNNTWLAKTDGPFKARALPANLSAELYLEGVPVVLDDKIKPQVFIYSSGEVTPFSYHLLFPGKDKSIKLDVNPIGEVKQEFVDNE